MWRNVACSAPQFTSIRKDCIRFQPSLVHLSKFLLSFNFFALRHLWQEYIHFEDAFVKGLPLLFKKYMHLREICHKMGGNYSLLELVLEVVMACYFHAFHMSVQSVQQMAWVNFDSFCHFWWNLDKWFDNINFLVLSNSTFNPEVNILVLPHILVVLPRLFFQCLYFILELKLA